MGTAGVVKVRASFTKVHGRESQMKAAAKTDPDRGARSPAATGVASRLMTAIKIGALVFALVLGAVAVTAWLSEEPETLSFDYEGFD